MVGVAPEATIYALPVLSPPQPMTFDGQVLLLYRQAIADGVRVFNNSWGIDGPVTDYTRAEAEQGLGLELTAYREAAAAGAILVWANGNGSFSQPEGQAGAPYLFPELLGHWITVAAVDKNGDLAGYSSPAAWARIIAFPRRAVILRPGSTRRCRAGSTAICRARPWRLLS